MSLSDLAVAWSRLAVPQDSDDAPTAARRRTCSELATIAAQLDPSKGDVSAAIKAWQMWHTTFILSDDPRHVIMTSTFARELRELQA